MSKKEIINHPHDFRRGVDHIGVCCVFFCHDGKGKFLLNKRSDKCRDEQGCWDPGGGALEFGEDPLDSVRREIWEEYCCEAKNIEFVAARNVLRKLTDGTPTHWISFIYMAEIDPSQVQNGDPDKIAELGWFYPEEFPEPLHSQFEAGFALLPQFQNK
jgi:8-oxo-dGTP diphosphatase